MSINRVMISGNLTRDPELRTTASGMPVMSIGVAVNDRRKNPQTGEWEDYPNFINCTMFGTRAQNLSNYLSKGTKVSIEGKLRWSQWDTQDGQKRSKIEVIIDELEFMSSRNNNNNNNNSGSQTQSGNYDASGDSATTSTSDTSTTSTTTPIVDTSSSVYDDDIPF